MSAVLDAKEQLHQVQQDLLQSGAVLVHVTLNMPGGHEIYPWSQLFEEAKRLVRARLANSNICIKADVEMLLATGPHCMLLVEADALRVKSHVVILEETHPWGRLWDLDVLTVAGPVDREALGLAPRKCLLCSTPAHECRKLRIHSPKEVISAAQKIAAQVGEHH